MEKLSGWLRNGLAFVGVLALGYSLGSIHTVKASGNVDEGELQFQLAAVNQTSSLLVYHPGTKTVYVYQGATTGNSELFCAYKFEVGKAGESIRRTNCSVPYLSH
jgi:hypothetical protein